MATKKKTTKKKTARKKRPAAKKKVAPAAGGEEQAILAALSKQEVDVVFDGHVSSEVTEVIPTGIYALDNYVIGIGGLPVGRGVELAAPEGGGKTSLAIAAIASVQREGGVALYIDGEQSVDRGRFKAFGADFRKTLFVVPDTMEDAMDSLETVVENLNPDRGPNLVVIDSVASLSPAREWEGKEKKPGEAASILTSRLRPLAKAIAQKRVCLLCINQLRDNVNGGMFAPQTYTPGGRYFRHFLSLRLHLYGPGKAVENSREEHVGKDILVKATKNRHSSPNREARVRLMFANGWDDQWTTIALAKRMECVPKSAHFNDKTYQAALKELDALLEE